MNKFNTDINEILIVQYYQISSAWSLKVHTVQSIKNCLECLQEQNTAKIYKSSITPHPIVDYFPITALLQIFYSIFY